MIMPFGKYKGCGIESLPCEYILALLVWMDHLQPELKFELWRVLDENCDYVDKDGRLQKSPWTPEPEEDD